MMSLLTALSRLSLRGTRLGCPFSTQTTSNFAGAGAHLVTRLTLNQLVDNAGAVKKVRFVLVLSFDQSSHFP
jgi:hypothetical protein